MPEAELVPVWESPALMSENPVITISDEHSSNEDWGVYLLRKVNAPAVAGQCLGAKKGMHSVVVLSAIAKMEAFGGTI